jgi:hypothetical protein
MKKQNLLLFLLVLSTFTAVISAQERDNVWPGPDTFRIGNAVSPVNYWMTAWMLNDVMKMAGFGDEIGSTEPSYMWVPVIEGQWKIGERRLVKVDRNGWPVSMELKNGRRADRFVTIVMGDADRPQAFPQGEYRLLYEGAGEILVEGAEVIREEPGKMVLRYDGHQTLFVSILRTDSNDHLRSIRILRPDAAERKRFNTAYLHYLKPFSVIRPLHFFGEQLSSGPHADWSQRKRVEYSHWGGSWGAPYEVAIDLANQSASDLWLNVPIAADDAYVRKLAELMLLKLDPERKLYLELGNELWNYTYPYEYGRQYVLRQAKKRWPGVLGTLQPYSDGDPVSEHMMIYSWQGMRTVRIRKIFHEVWGKESGRLFTVLAAQIGGSHPRWHPSRALLETPVYAAEEDAEPCGYQVDAFAVAPYIGEPGGDYGFRKSLPVAFIADAVAYVRGEGKWKQGEPEEGLRYALRNDKQLAEEFGLPLVAYEGGQHFMGSRFTRDIVNTHPMMRDLYETLFTVWQEEGGGLFVHFAGIIPRGQNEPGTDPGYFESENFGIKELQTQNRREAPKWDAVLSMMERIGQLE